jgi:hypothetical protein
MSDAEEVRPMNQTHHERTWRNTMMTIADLASRAPSAYELLYRLGLERRRSRAMRAASRAGWLGIGMALGSGLALLFTPRSGPEVRERLSEQARRARDYVAPSEDESDSFGRTPTSSPASPGARAARRP